MFHCAAQSIPVVALLPRPLEKKPVGIAPLAPGLPAKLQHPRRPEGPESDTSALQALAQGLGFPIISVSLPTAVQQHQQQQEHPQGNLGIDMPAQSQEVGQVRD